MARLVDCYPSSDDELPSVSSLAKKPNNKITQTPKPQNKTPGPGLIPKSTVRPSTRKVRRLGDFGKAQNNPLFQKWDMDQDDTSRFGARQRLSPMKSPSKSRNTTHISFAASESEQEDTRPRFRSFHARRTAEKLHVDSDSDEDVFGRNGTPQIKVGGIEQDVPPLLDSTAVADDTKGTVLEAVSLSYSSTSETSKSSEEHGSEEASNASTSFAGSEKDSSGFQEASGSDSDQEYGSDSDDSLRKKKSPRKKLFAKAETKQLAANSPSPPIRRHLDIKGHEVETVAAQVVESLSEDEWDPVKQLEEELASREEARPTTPPTTPPKASPSDHASPSKHIRIPKTPHRPSTDAFWNQEFVDDWNEQHSPRKLILPLGNRSPNRLSPKKESRKAFDAKKHSLAESFLLELDTRITGGKISELAEATGGVKLIWTKALNTTAGRANWKRETIRSWKADEGRDTEHYKHHASIELAEKVIDEEQRLLNVIAHEFCHLANFMVNGVTNNPHGREFKVWAAKCSRVFGDRGIKVTTKHSYDIDFKYVWTCTECGSEYKRHSKSIDLQRHRCGSCKGQLKQTKPVPRGGIGRPTEYQMFVKEQMKLIKQENPGSPQKDLMRIVAEKWAKRNADKTTVEDVVEQMVDLTLETTT